MGRIGIVCLTFLLFSQQMLARSSREWINVYKLKPGTPVWVELWKGVTLKGKFQSADSSRLRIVLTYPWDGRPIEEVARKDVRRVIRVSRFSLPDPHKVMVGGALIGGATGAAAVAIGDKNDCQGCKGFRIILGGASGGASGAVLGFVGGAAVEGGFGVVALFHRNKVVYEDTSSFPLRQSGSPLGSGDSRSDLHGNQLGSAPGILDGGDCVFRCQFAHQERKLAVGGHHNWTVIKPPYVLSSQDTATIHFDDELGVIHWGNFIVRGSARNGQEIRSKAMRNHDFLL